MISNCSIARARFTGPRVDKREGTDKVRAEQGILRYRAKFNCTTRLTNRLCSFRPKPASILAAFAISISLWGRPAHFAFIFSRMAE